MSPLHHDPFDVMLHYLGKSMLHKLLKKEKNKIITNMNNNILELGFGPMSSESIEAVYQYSNYHRRP